MNVLHLHLSDDQGWRIEIKSWPNLATHGGSKQVGGGDGGYYTHISEFYLAARFEPLEVLSLMDEPILENSPLEEDDNDFLPDLVWFPPAQVQTFWLRFWIQNNSPCNTST